MISELECNYLVEHVAEMIKNNNHKDYKLVWNDIVMLMEHVGTDTISRKQLFSGKRRKLISRISRWNYAMNHMSLEDMSFVPWLFRDNELDELIHEFKSQTDAKSAVKWTKGSYGGNLEANGKRVCCCALHSGLG
jgi:hypothetical protein